MDLASGALARGLRMISDIVIDPADGASREHLDLAVVARADGRALRAAWRALRPGGTVYVECRSRRLGLAHRLRKQLRAAGFGDIRLYWPRPDPDTALARAWLPLDSPHAVAHHLGTRAAPQTRWQWVRNAIATRPWILRMRMRLARPVCGIASKPGPAGVPTSGPDAADHPASGLQRLPEPLALLDAIRAGWQEWGLGPAPERLDLTLLTGGSRSISKVAALVFSDGDPEPRLAVKIARVPEANAGLEHEVAVLRALESRRASPPGIPRVLFRRDHAGLLAVGETALGGLPLYSALHEDTALDLALKATRWLVSLAGGPDIKPREEWCRRLVHPALRDFDSSFGAVIDRGMLRATEDALATLGPLPSVCEQRDFASWNILVTPSGDLAVLDWESAELQGLPTLDLIYFLTYLGFSLDKAQASDQCRASYRSTFDGGARTGHIAAECLSVYAGAMAVPLSALHPLRLLTWLIHSRSDFRHMTADAGGRPESARLRRSLFLSLWDEEVRRGQAHRA